VVFADGSSTGGCIGAGLAVGNAADGVVHRHSLVPQVSMPVSSPQFQALRPLTFLDLLSCMG
jgi:hypothetical protein